MEYWLSQPWADDSIYFSDELDVDYCVYGTLPGLALGIWNLVCLVAGFFFAQRARTVREKFSEARFTSLAVGKPTNGKIYTLLGCSAVMAVVLFSDSNRAPLYVLRAAISSIAALIIILLLGIGKFYAVSTGRAPFSEKEKVKAPNF